MSAGGVTEAAVDNVQPIGKNTTASTTSTLKKIPSTGQQRLVLLVIPPSPSDHQLSDITSAVQFDGTINEANNGLMAPGAGPLTPVFPGRGAGTAKR